MSAPPTNGSGGDPMQQSPSPGAAMAANIASALGAALAATTSGAPPAPAAAAAAAAPAAAAAAPAAAGTATTAAATTTTTTTRPALPPHKSTAIIPGWSRPLSSAALVVECQRIGQPSRLAPARDCVGVMELEVMKFVAYCGGLTLRLRIDELPSAEEEEEQRQNEGGGSPGAAGPPEPVTWGLSALRPCPQLVTVIQQQQAEQQQRLQQQASPSSAAPPPPPRPSWAQPGPGASRASPATPTAVDSPSRKPLYSAAATSTLAPLRKGDVLSLDLAPREDGQPVIVATFGHNGSVVHRASLPCAAIAALQMYPFVTVPRGATVSLHEALTPSPLFTWYSPSSATADISMADLDTCVKYSSPATPSPPPVSGPNGTPGGGASGSGATSDFHGATALAGGRHRWTVQLDNLGAAAGYVFVGLVTADPSPPPSGSILAATLPAPLAGRMAMMGGTTGVGGVGVVAPWANSPGGASGAAAVAAQEAAAQAAASASASAAAAVASAAAAAAAAVLASPAASAPPPRPAPCPPRPSRPSCRPTRSRASTRPWWRRWPRAPCRRPRSSCRSCRW